MRRLLVIVGITGVLALVVALVVIYGAKLKYRSDYRGIRDQRNRELAKFLPSIEEDQRLLSAEPFFAERPATRDAGPFLNPRVSWDGNKKLIAAWRAKQPIPKPLFVIPDAVKKKLDSWPGGNWVDHAADIDFSELPLDLFAELLQFDYWDVERNSPVADLSGPDFFEEPLVDFPALNNLARLRLLKALQDGKFDSAAAEVNQLAWLMHSTETLIGALYAVAVQTILSKAQEKFVAGGGQTQFKPVAADLGKRAKRLAFALPELTTLDTPIDVARRVVGSDRVRFGRCAAFNEGMPSVWLVRPLLRDEMPEQFAALGDLMTSERGCRLHRLRSMWNDPSAIVPEYAEMFAGSARLKHADAATRRELPATFRFVPAVTATVGYITAAIAAPDRFKYYRAVDTDHSEPPATAPASAPSTPAH